GLKASELSPVGQHRRITKEVGDKGFMVALEADHLTSLTARNQHIQYLPRPWTSVDVVAEKYFNDLKGWMGRDVGVDDGKKLRQEVGAPVHISDRVDAEAVRRPRPPLVVGSRPQRPHEF